MEKYLKPSFNKSTTRKNTIHKDKNSILMDYNELNARALIVNYLKY